MRALTHPGWERSLWLMVAVRLAMSASFSIALPFMPLYVMQLGVVQTSQVVIWAGAISSISFLSSALLSPLWGSVSDRIGRKVMVVRSSIAASAALMAAGLCHNVWQLFAVQAGAGIFGGFSAASMALLATQVPEERLGFALGWLATGQLVGSLLGPLAGGAIADRLHDYRSVYFTAAAAALAVTLACTAFVRESFEPVHHPRGGPSIIAQFRELMRHPALIPLLGVMLLTQGTTLAAQPVIPLLVRGLLGNAGWIATAAGFAMAVTGLADVLASPWLGKRSDVIGYRKVLIISLIGAAAFTIPQAFAPNYWSFITLRFGVGIFLGGILPAANALLARLFPREQRGQVFGLASSATFLGMFLGPLLGGLVAARFGFAALFIAIGALMLVNLVIVLALPGTPASVRTNVR